MKTYAKLTETGALHTLERVPHVTNATEAQFEAYAKANGYKELVTTESPGMYYSKTYTEDDEVIRQGWTPWDLQAAKQHALNVLQGRRDAAMHNVVIACEALPNGILYTTEAMTMAQGLVILQSKGALPEGTTWTDAADEAHVVTPDLLDAIVTSMLIHVNTTQAGVQQARDKVREAMDVDEVEAALGKPETQS